MSLTRIEISLPMQPPVYVVSLARLVPLRFKRLLGDVAESITIVYWKYTNKILKITIMIPESLWFHDSGIDSDSSQRFFDSVNDSWFWLWFVILRLILDFKLIPETVIRDSTRVGPLEYT